MARYKPYERYKDSGVEWIGEIPEHWEVKKIKRIAQLKSGESITSLNINDVGDFPVYGGNGVRGYATNYTHDGSFVVIGRQGALCGNINYAIGKFWASEHAVVASPRGSYQTIWFGELLRAMNLNQYSTAAAQPGLAVEQIINLAIPIPLSSEQQAIADLLDQKTSEIDGLVADKEKLVSLLQEYRQAIISEAVTKGLNPDVKMKDSGVEWIGEIPNHWEIKRLKQSVEGCINGIWGEEPQGDENDIVCIRVADFNRINNNISANNLTIRSVPRSLREERELKSRNLLIEKSGGGEQQPVGVVVIYSLEIPAVCSNFIGRMPVAEGFSPEFLKYLHANIYSTKINLRSIKQTTGIQNLDIASYLNERAAFPKLSEQQAIADYLDQKTAEIDDLISGIQESIDQLKSYRQSLISEAVTGKIDVRGVI